MSEIKIGDTVGCSDHLPAACVAGKVTYGPDRDGHYTVEGSWTDGQPWHYVRPDQITRHVPAAPVPELPKSVGDKLASEMTVREQIIKDVFIKAIDDYDSSDMLSGEAEFSVKAADALIAAIEERHAAKVTGLADQIKLLQERLDSANAALSLVRTDNEGVWLWQGDGSDELQSLVCPVVMSADTLRGIEARHSEAIKQARREAYEDAAKMADELFKDTHCGCDPAYCSCEKLNAFAREATEELAAILREKAGKL